MEVLAAQAQELRKVSSYTALLNACILYPASLRDLVMEIAAAGLFRARWTPVTTSAMLTSMPTNSVPVFACG
jgi:hypothetical protein